MAKENREALNSMFAALKTFITDKGFAPTERELCMLTGLSRSTLHSYMVRLKFDGLIDYIPQKSRTIRILKNPDPDSGVLVENKCSKFGSE